MKKRLLSVNDMPIERMAMLKRVDFSFRTIGKGIMVLERHKSYSSRTLEQNARKFAEGDNSAVPLVLYTWHPSQKTEVFDLAARERNPDRKSIHTAKFDRCVTDVKRSGSPVNPYAVCSSAIGYRGSVKKGHRRRNPSEKLGQITADTVRVGQRVTYSGFPATVIKLLEYSRHGKGMMVEIRLPRGTSAVSVHDLVPIRKENPLPSVRKVYYLICAVKPGSTRERYYLKRSGKLTRRQADAARFATAAEAVAKARTHLAKFPASRSYRFDVQLGY